MKRTISLLSILALVLAFNNNATAQVTASAEILPVVSYSADADLNFGTFTTSMSAATIDPTGTGGDSGNLNGSAGTDYTAGRYSISGSGSQQVQVQLDNSNVTLTNTTDGSSTDDMSLSATLSQASGSSSTDRGGAAFTSGNNVTLSGGDATIWIGGTLTPNDNGGVSGIDPGTYENTTDLTLTVSYVL